MSSEKDQAKYGALIARDYPDAVILPWQEKARAALGDTWQAHILPLGGSNAPVFYTLRRQGPYVDLHGLDPDKLVSLAKWVDAFRSEPASAVQ